MRRTARIGVLTILFVILAGSSLVAAAPASYVVKSGDCLWNIASANGLTVDQIKQLNGLGSDSLQIGQVLKLTSSATNVGVTSTKVSAPVTTPTPAPAPAPAGTALYVVQPGDNLWSIAQRHNTTVDKLRALNGLSSDALFAGNTLKITADAAVVSIPVPTPAPVPAPAPAPVTAAEPAGVSLYVIQSGDNLWSIAQLHGTTVDNLRALNGLTGDALYAGETLKVSGTPVVTAVSRSGDSASGSRIVSKAAQYLGTPYRYGGSAPGGFDCSGFTSYIFKQFNISLARTAAGQYAQGTAVSKANLIPGDLVFFNTSGGISHVGIFVGNGKFIHSSSPRSGGVIYSGLGETYYASRYVGARRVIR